MLTTRKRPHQEGQRAVTNHIDAATEAVTESIGTWAPENALDLDAFLAGLPRLFEAVASSVARVAERLGSAFPVHPPGPQHPQELSPAVAREGQLAGQSSV